MELAILFWCFKDAEVCAHSLRVIRHYNPAKPIYVLFGGDPAEARQFEATIAPFADDFYVFDEDRPPAWKWRYGDILVSRWFTDRGHRLRWDSLTVVQWDMLVWGPLEQLFGELKRDQLLLSGLRPIHEVAAWWGWLNDAHEYPVYEEFLRENDLRPDDAWCCLFIVVVLPRAFLQRFSVRRHPELGLAEYAIPTLAKSWGFEFCTRHPYTPWWRADPQTRDALPHDKVLNAVGEECPDREVLLHLLDPSGLRAFHPYYKQLHAEKLSDTLPAWLSFVHCADLDYADLPAESTRSVFNLAQDYFDHGDFANARTWYERRVGMGGWDEEVFCSMYQAAAAMANLGVPWTEVQDAYLRAWGFRPTRAEPLWAIAVRYREGGRHELGYLFAERAASIPFPASDNLFVRSDIYDWRAADEQAVCASWTGRQPEAFTIWRRLLAGTDLPEHDRQRIATNRDVCVPTMLEQASTYPDSLVSSLCTHPGDPDIVVTLTAGPDLHTTENTLNTFLHCCRDITRVGRFLILDTTLTTQDHTTLLDRYSFLHPIPTGPDDEPDAQLAHLRHHIHARYWLHLGQGWKFFAPEDLITRLIGVLDAEPDIARVAINLDDATTLTGLSAPDTTTRHTPHAGRYVLTHTPTDTPASTPTTSPTMTDTTRPNTTHTATLDEVLCIEEGSRAV